MLTKSKGGTTLMNILKKIMSHFYLFWMNHVLISSTVEEKAGEGILETILVIKQW
jgi:hypothetical protein